NLRQIGLAMRGYESTHGSFPPGFVSHADVENAPGTGPGWGWAAQLLPNLGLGHVSIDLKTDITDPVNDQTRVMTLVPFLCAADTRVPNNKLDHVEDANSEHPLGVNFLFCDGSVQTVGDDIDPKVWEALGTRAGGEPTGKY